MGNRRGRRRHDTLKQTEARKGLIEKMTTDKHLKKVRGKMWICGRKGCTAEEQQVQRP